MDTMLSFRTKRICRIHRVGVRPVLEAEVSYPVLCAEGAPLSEAALRFNRTYETVAENWLAWVEGPLLEAVTAEFTAAGPMAAYRFGRRRAECLMSISDVFSEGAPDGDMLTVTRTVRLTSSLRETAEWTAADRWRWPRLTLAAVNEAAPCPCLSDSFGKT